jgi:TRAP-type mannitol/chloroaromatic compound transport system permease large subunit
MGYVMERGALVDKMFHAVQLAFRRLPGSLAVATLVICTFWGIASGLVGAVVVLMGVIAMRPMLNAGYDTRLAAGVITAGGTLGILIPPSVMIIVYAAVAGQSVVKLYAAAMFPGFFLAFLYLVYVIGWVMINPKIAPRLPEEQTKAPVSPWLEKLGEQYSKRMLPAMAKAVLMPGRALQIKVEDVRVTWGLLVRSFVMSLAPVFIVLAALATSWWYVVIYSQATANAQAGAEVVQMGTGIATEKSVAAPEAEGLKELGGDEVEEAEEANNNALSLGDEVVEANKVIEVPESFYTGFWGTAVALFLLLAWYYKNFDAEQYEILNMLVKSVMPLGILTAVVLGVILLGLATATESAAVGATGAFIMAWWSGSLDLEKTKQAVFLTAKTTSMVCWLFVGSALFSAVFAVLGGQRLVEEWVMAMNLTPLQFMLLSQAIIFILGWPLEWTEIIVIFVPIFLPLLAHFQIDPILWGVLVFVNLQAAFLSPPVAMSAFYLKGVSPPHVTINQIFAGMMPYMFIVIICMVLMYIWPGLTLWLPEYLYGPK